MLSAEWECYYWQFLLRFAGLPIIWSLMLIHAYQVRHRQGFCRECGYDLTGNASGVCPECGTNVPHQTINAG